ncbi:hypothetical protein G7Y89_g5513 [Cudoniella acicularis]|uniref:SAP domain-containing protein n=1 Tax=Cudoniella acicularis TaxID=354080 RepID=A0A8H4RNW2_9HELO|nr:hypothetical protein G7Y89_g5513 [Cudoniella acicularis]
MPRAKRPLAELDPNASRAAPKAKHSKPNLPIERTEDGGTNDIKSKTKAELVEMLQERGLRHTGTKFELLKRLEDHREEMEKLAEKCKSKQQTVDNNYVNYHMKDNSKLRTLLRDRQLPEYGTREEMIQRLERVPVSYERFSSGEITEMLKGRGLRFAGSGSRDIKMARLKLNDEMNSDSGNSAEQGMYGRLTAYESFEDLDITDPKQIKSNTHTKYASWASDRLIKLLKERRLSLAGNKAQHIEKLRDYDAKALSKKRKSLFAERIRLRAELEERVGHPVDLNEFKKETRDQSRRDDEILKKVAESAKAAFPRCEYNWKDSHWASRTERELREICERRGMEVWGTKATYLKWLDTGSVDYEDLSVSSLEQVCMKREIRTKSSDKKVDLIRRLREADESEEAEGS